MEIQQPTASSQSTLAFIGAGVIAEAAIRRLLERDLFHPRHVVASHPRVERRQFLTEALGIRCVPSNREAAAADVVVLAVKPQVLPSVLEDLRGAIREEAFILSMVAGAGIQSITSGAQHPAVVRCMPNTPAQVGEGMTVWTATAEVSGTQRLLAARILAAMGAELWVDKEEYLDMATAVSGTGPAYVFLLMEALIDAAVHLGFSRQVARQLVFRTVRGAALFAEQATLHPAELRNMVTSPGGTTAAALYQLEKGSFRTIISKAVWAAFQRSVGLGQIQAASSLKTSNGESPSSQISIAPTVIIE